MKNKILVIFCMVFTTTLIAQTPNHTIYFGGGTTGISLGYRNILSQNIAARADLSAFVIKDFEIDNDGESELTGELGFKNFGLYGDYFLFNSGFFASAGLILGNNEIKAKSESTANGSIEINDNIYRYGSGDFVEITAEYPEVRPYLGLGYSNHKRNGFAFNFNIGVAYGKADVSAKYSQNFSNYPGFQNDIDKEIEDIEDDLPNIYPIVNIGFSYSF